MRIARWLRLETPLSFGVCRWVGADILSSHLHSLRVWQTCLEVFLKPLLRGYTTWLHLVSVFSTFKHGRDFGNDLAPLSREEPTVPVITGLPL